MVILSKKGKEVNHMGAWKKLLEVLEEEEEQKKKTNAKESSTPQPRRRPVISQD